MKYLKLFSEGEHIKLSVKDKSNLLETPQEKRPFEEWVQRYFEEEHFDRQGQYWISRYEYVVLGFGHSDLSHYRQADLEEEYQQYLRNFEGEAAGGTAKSKNRFYNNN